MISKRDELDQHGATMTALQTMANLGHIYSLDLQSTFLLLILLATLIITPRVLILSMQRLRLLQSHQRFPSRCTITHASRGLAIPTWIR